MKTTGNGLTLIALSTGGASLVRVAATIAVAFGSASEEKGASASAGALISDQKWWWLCQPSPIVITASSPALQASYIAPNQLAKL